MLWPVRLNYFNKSVLRPQVAKANYMLWPNFPQDFTQNTEIETVIPELKHLLNVVHMVIQNISNKGSPFLTGNKPVKLLPWESNFLTSRKCKFFMNPL